MRVVMTIEAHDELNEILEASEEEVTVEVEADDPEKLSLMESLGLLEKSDDEEDSTDEVAVEPEDDEETSSEAAETVEEEPEASEEPETKEADERPFEDRFGELTEGLEEPEVDQTSPEALLKQRESELLRQQEALQQYDFSGAVPAGVSTEEQLNEYVQNLRDRGEELEASRVLDTYHQKLREAQEYTQRLQQFTQAREQFEVQKHQVEWDRVQKQWLETIPEVEPYLGDIRSRLLAQMESDPAMEARVGDFNGKMKAVLKVYRELGIADKLSKGQPEAKIKTPSAPDANVVSKKVKRKGNDGGPVFRRSELAKAKYTDVDMDKVFAAMKAGRIIDDL